jgi:type VI secretion system protein ImpF
VTRPQSTVITQSLWDRLREHEELPASHAAAVRFLKESIRRDLEDLLNTRRPLVRELEGYDLARTSVINYGLEDLSSFYPSSGSSVQDIQQAVRRCIAEYEPRLVGVTVAVENSDPSRHEIRLHIEAMLPIHPSAETVSFDTMLDVASGVYSVD